MTASSTQSAMGFAQRIRAGEPLVGTFIKVPTTHTSEIIGTLGFDFIVVDQEHAPFDRLVIDTIILAGLASGMAPLVRVDDAAPANILSVLDCGAAGVLVPHVDSVEKARAVASACRYRNGSRGFSRTGRAGRYGAVNMGDHIAQQDATILCIAMIEDAAALDNIESIVAVDGIDALFIGRADLSVAMGETSSSAPRVAEAVRSIVQAAVAEGKPVLFVAESVADRQAMTELGCSAFLLGSDVAFLRRAAQLALTEHGRTA